MEERMHIQSTSFNKPMECYLGPIKLEAYKLPIFNAGKDATKANF